MSKTNVNAKQDLVQQFLAGKLSRREFAAAACGLGFAAATVDRVLAGQQPPPQFTDQPAVEYPLTQEKVTFRVLTSAVGHVADYANDNDFTAWYEEKTNVHIEWEIVPGEEAQNAVNLRLASGDYPDIILGSNSYAIPPAVEMLYGAQGVFLPLNDLIEQHGVYYKEVVKQYPFTEQAVTATDGNIYSFPYVNDCYHCSMDEKMWIYKPWLDQLGLPMPQTTEEYAAVLKAFKEQDPNGNGQGDEWPVASSIDNWNGELDLFFVNAFTFNPGGAWLYLNEGQVTAAYVQEGWKEAIKYLADLYAQDLIAPETFTQDSAQLIQMVDNADAALVGCAPCGWKGGISATDLKEPDSRITGYVTLPPLAGPRGVRYAAYNPYVGYTSGYFLVTSRCENPELAVRWADGMYEFETTTRSTHGIKDRDWRWANEGEVGINGEPAIWAGLDSEESQASPPNTGWGQTGPSFRSNAFRLGEAIDPAEAATHLEVILYNETKTNYEPYQQPEEMAMPPLWFTEEQSAQVAELTTTIENYVRETFARAVTGQTDIEAEWESYLATLEGMGLQQFVQVHQEAHDAKYDG